MVKTGRSAKAMRKIAMAALKPLRVPIGPALKEIHKEDLEVNDTGWYTQLFLAGRRHAGYLNHDVCLYNTPPEIVEEMKERTMMQTRIPVDLHKWFKRYAFDSNQSMAAIIVGYLTRLRLLHKKTVEPEQF